MDKSTLDQRCAQLKARMLAIHRHPKDLNTPGVPSDRSVGNATASIPLSKTIESPSFPPVELRNPHPLIKAALSGMRDVGEEYGRLQFRWGGFVDARVGRVSARRSLKMMDSLIKRVEESGLRITIGAKDPGFYGRSRGFTFVTDAKEKVQITVIEETRREANPAWRPDRWGENRFVYQPTGRLSLVLDADTYGTEKWTDKRGHVIEEHLEAAHSAILKKLEFRHHARHKAEQNHLREIERQKIQAEEDRQHREQEKRIEQLKDWGRDWAEAERLRAFLSAWEESVGGQSGVAIGSPQDGFRRWATMVIDKIDPLI